MNTSDVEVMHAVKQTCTKLWTWARKGVVLSTLGNVPGPDRPCTAQLVSFFLRLLALHPDYG